MIVFVASYATGLGNVPWQQGELFSLEGMVLSVSDSINVTHTPFFLTSTRHRHLARHGDQLGGQPAHRLHVSLAHGEDHPGRRLRVLRGHVSPRLALRPRVLPGNGGPELGGGQTGVPEWVWDQEEPGAAEEEAGDQGAREGEEGRGGLMPFDECD
jgi:hypothetical protein